MGRDNGRNVRSIPASDLKSTEPVNEFRPLFMPESILEPKEPVNEFRPLFMPVSALEPKEPVNEAKPLPAVNFLHEI